jgi:Flp pilus assembly CpaF family ATPase
MICLDPRARVEHARQERIITATIRRGSVDRREHRLNLGELQIFDGTRASALEGHGQHALTMLKALGVLGGTESKEGVNRCEAHVAVAASSFDRILPFIKPLEELLRDPTVTEVMVNEGGRCVFVEPAGRLEPIPGLRLEPRNLQVAIKNIARTCGDDISEDQPILDARLADGSRVAAMFPPCAVNGAALTIRKFTHRYTLDELVASGSVPAAAAQQLHAAIGDQRNILISGGTGTGKTTLLNALAATIPSSDRLVLIEETSEIHLEKPNLLRFEARRPKSHSATKCRSDPSRLPICCGPRCGTVPIASC